MTEKTINYKGQKLIVRRGHWKTHVIGPDKTIFGISAITKNAVQQAKRYIDACERP